MKRIPILLLIMTCFIFQPLMAKKYVINKAKVEWIGKKIGGKHNGFIQLKEGFIETSKQQIHKGSFVIDMTTITCEDLTNESLNKKLVDHLKSDDFFSVAKHPTAEIKILQAEKFEEGKAQITAMATIKGVSKPITFISHKEEDGYSAHIKIDRSQFDVRYGSNSFFDNLGNKAIDDIFIINVHIVTE